MREVTCAAADLTELLDASGANGYTRADCSAVALCTDELEEDAMITVGVHVFEERGRLADV